MQCPLCSSEIGPNAVVCDKCGATRITQRTPLGVLVGWLGMLIGLLWLMVLAPVLILPFVGYSLHGYPWSWLVVGGALAAGLLWYSKSTLHAEWKRLDS